MLIDLAKMAKILKFGLANSLLDSPTATWLNPKGNPASTGALLFIDWIHYLLCIDDHHGIVTITPHDRSGYIGCGQPGGDRGVEVEATLGDEDERGDTQDGEQEEKTRRDAPHPHTHPRHYDHLNAGVQLPGEERRRR